MKILITGAGSVGLGLASFLIKSGAEVHILAREKAVEELAIHGLVRTGIFGNNTAHPDQFRVISALNDLDQKNFDYILVAVKSFDSVRGDACRRVFYVLGNC